MKIVVLDGHTLNPGDLSWEGLKQLGEVSIYPRTPRDQVVARAKGAPILLTNKTVLDALILQQLPKLKYIGVLATGYNVVDVDYCQKHGIIVTNVPGYGPKTVAQMVFAHILNLTNHVYLHHLSVIQGKWSKGEDFCYWEKPILDLEGKVLGIIGFGQVGREVAQMAKGFGLKTIVHTRNIPNQHFPDIKFVSLTELIKTSDIISLNCPLTKQTYQMVNKDFLQQMKTSAFLINCGRGDLIDETALKWALENNKIAGAGLDVLSQEPPPLDHPLFSCPNVFFTPHIAWAGRKARQNLLNIAIQNVKSFLAGKPENVVNP